MSKHLLICNEEDLRQTKWKALKTFFKSENTVTNLSDLKAINPKKLEAFQTIFIRAELDWPRQHSYERHAYKGFRLAEQELRLQEVRARIVFLSEATLDAFELEGKGDSSILAAPGSGFLNFQNLSEKTLQASSVEAPISEANLFRIKYGYCDLDAKINTQFHKLKEDLDRKIIEGNGAIDLGDISDFVRNKINEIGGNYTDNLELQTKIRNYGKQIDFASINEVKRFGINRFDLKTKSESVGQLLKMSDRPEQKPWKILILDDQPDLLYHRVLDKEGKEVEQNYQDILNVKEVIVARTVNDAKAIVLKDEALFNEIAVIISDLSLRQENGLSQTEQGEDFIQWLESRPHAHHTFLISYLPRNVIRKAVREFKFRCSDYYKLELRSDHEEFKKFITDIYEKGEDIWNVLLNRPAAERWAKSTEENKLPLKTGYNHFRNHIDYKYYETFITNESNRAIQAYKNNQPLPELKFSVSEFNYNAHGLPGFCQYLIARRVIIWLYKVMGVEDKLEIGKIIKPSTFDKLDSILKLRKDEAITQAIVTNQLMPTVRLSVNKKILSSIATHLGLTPSLINEETDFDTQKLIQWARANQMVLVEEAQRDGWSYCKLMAEKEVDERTEQLLENQSPRRNEQITKRVPTTKLQTTVYLCNTNASMAKVNKALDTKWETSVRYSTTELLTKLEQTGYHLVEVNLLNGKSYCKIMTSKELAKRENSHPNVRKDDQVFQQKPGTELKATVVLNNNVASLKKIHVKLANLGESLPALLKPKQTYATKDLIRYASLCDAFLWEEKEEDGVSFCKINTAKAMNNDLNKDRAFLDLRKNDQITKRTISTELKATVVLNGDFRKINNQLDTNGIKIESGESYATEDAIKWAILYNHLVNGASENNDPLKQIQLIETKVENGISYCRISSIGEYEQFKQENSKKQLFSNLALNLEYLPFGLLIEEKNWLNNHTEWNGGPQNDAYRALQAKILNCVNDLIDTPLYQEKINSILID